MGPVPDHIHAANHRGGGKRIETVVEVVEYEPDRAYGMRITEGIPVHGQITLEPTGTGSGSHFRFRVHSEPTGMMRLAAPIMGALLKRQFNQHCDNLKTVLEAETTA